MDEQQSDRRGQYQRERQRDSRRRFARAAVPVVVIALAVVGLGAAFVSTTDRNRDAGAQAASGARDIPARLAEDDFDDETVVVVVGDSFTAGTDINTGPEWDERLAAERDWILREDAVVGSGYVAGDRFSDRRDNIDGIEADLVILAGGRNDSPNDGAVLPAVRAEVGAAQQEFPTADLVLFSPFASGTPTPAELQRAGDFSDLADELGVDFVGVTDMLPDRVIGEDDVHPDDNGHEILAQKIGRQLDRLGVPRADAYRAAAR